MKSIIEDLESLFPRQIIYLTAFSHVDPVSLFFSSFPLLVPPFPFLLLNNFLDLGLDLPLSVFFFFVQFYRSLLEITGISSLGFWFIFCLLLALGHLRVISSPLTMGFVKNALYYTFHPIQLRSIIQWLVFRSAPAGFAFASRLRLTLLFS